jgi:hypothetical protein
MDLMEERRFELCSFSAGGSASAEGKDRFREGERKELGESEGRRWVGEGHEVIGGSLFSLVSDEGSIW